MTTVAAAVVPALLVVLAFVNPGVKVAQVDLHDGSVWITARSAQKLGRFNAQIKELNGGVVANRDQFDVLQSGPDVLLVEAGAATVVDPAAVSLSTPVALPAGAAVAMDAGTVAVTSPEGGLWVSAFSALAGISLDPGAADATLGAGAVTVVTKGGAALAFDPTTGKVTRVEVVDGEKVVTTGPELEGAKGIVPEAVAAVGDALVVLAAGRLHADGWVADLSSLGGVVLQQTGPSHEHVLLGSPSGLVRVSLDDGEVAEVPTGASGTPAAPVYLAGCEYGAWSSTAGSYLRSCGDDEPQIEALTGVDGASELRFRTNRNVIALNDVREGMVWLPADVPTMHRPDWDTIDREEESRDEEKATDEVESTTDTLEECKEQTSTPQPRPDDYGVRAGRTRILQVLNNDVSVECGVLTITELDEIPAAFGTISPVYGGRALQLAVQPGATGSVDFTYSVSDGRAGNIPQTTSVRLTVVPSGANSAPVQDRRPTFTVEAGASLRADVLASFSDPDGDDLQLVGASVVSGSGQVRARLDGILQFDATGAELGRRVVRVTVSDGEEQVKGEVNVDIRAPGTVPPVIDPIHATARQGELITVDVLASVRSVSNEPPRLAAVDAVEGTEVAADTAAGTFTFRSSVTGTYYVPVVVTAGTQQAARLARIDVVAVPETILPPVAVRDTALLPLGGEVTIDPLANDTDPSGSVLVLVSATARPGSDLRLGVINHRQLRISSERSLGGPETVEYVVSNGPETARGEILVIPTDPSAAQRPPVVPDVEVTVRTGGVVTVPVLEDAFDPDGDEMTLVRQIAEAPADGLLFVSGDVLRYQAGPNPGRSQALFQVADSNGNVTSARLTVNVHASDRASKEPARPLDLMARVFEGETVRISVPLVGIDRDGDGVTLLGQASAPTKGRILSVGADYLEYEALPGESGTDTFTYAVEDWVGQRSVATIRVGIALRSAERPPIVARDETVQVRPGERIEVRVLANDVDPSGSALSIIEPFTAPEGIDARVEGRRIVVQTPVDEGVWAIPYTVGNAVGGRASAVLTVRSVKDAAIEPPVARDVVVPAIDTIDKTTVEVDVLAVAENPSGPLTDLAVSVPSSHAAVAQVNGARKVVVTLGDTARTIPYLLTNTRPEANNVGSYAFITVPALGDFPPVLRPKARELRVAAGAELLIDLDEFVQVGPGRTARISNLEGVSATRSDGSALTVDESTLRYVSDPAYAGPASITFEVTDAAPGALDARFKVLTLPITVYATEDYPPQFLVPTLDVAQGGAPISLDLNAVTRGPEGETPGQALYAFAITTPPPAGVTATINGTVLTLQASTGVQPETVGKVGIRISYGARGVLDEAVNVRVTQSDRQAPRVQDFAVDALPGVASTVNVLAGAFNPFAPEPLRVVSADVVAGQGTVSVSGSSLAITPAVTATGTMKVRFRVRDVTNVPTREAEGIVTVTIAEVPATPTAPVAKAGSGPTVDLSWDAPVSAPPVTEYEVKLNDGTVVRSIGTRLTVRDLQYDREYTFSVRARNLVGWSEWSPVSNAVRLEVTPEAPNAPSVQFKDQALAVSWSEPRSEGLPITGYEVQVVGGTGANLVVASSTTSREITGLRNGTSYAVQVRATNSMGNSSPWSPATTETPAGRPGAPTLKTLQGDGTITVEWSGADSNGAKISGYTISVSGGESRTRDGSRTSETFAVKNGEDYTFTVVATNRAGNSEPASIKARTWAVPGPATRGDVVQTNPTGAAFGGGEVRYSWNPPSNTGRAGKGIDFYWVRIGDGERQRVEGTSVTVSGQSSEATSPTVSVRPCIVEGGSDVCPGTDLALRLDGIRVVTVPQAPEVTVEPTGGIGFKWTVRQRSDGGAPAELNVCVQKGSGSRECGKKAEDGDLYWGSVTVTAYATNSAGSGKEGTASTTTTPSAPSAPQNLAATSPVELGVTATWDAPSNNGGVDIKEYKWAYRKKGTSSWSDGTVAHSQRTYSFSVPEADGGSEYDVRVRAVNDANKESDWVSTTVTVTPKTPPPGTDPPGGGGP